MFFMRMQFYKRYYLFLKRQEQKNSSTLNQLRFKKKKVPSVKAQSRQTISYYPHVMFGSAVSAFGIYHILCNLRLQMKPFNLFHDPTVLDNLVLGSNEPEFLLLIIKYFFIMTFGDINFILILFFFMFTSITININTALHLLLTAEFL